MIIYLDHVLVIEKAPRDTEEFKGRLATKFAMKDLGEVKYYLGCYLGRERVNKTLTVHQRVYTKSIVNRFDVVKMSDSPSSSGMILSKQNCPKSEEEKS